MLAHCPRRVRWVGVVLTASKKIFYLRVSSRFMSLRTWCRKPFRCIASTALKSVRLVWPIFFGCQLTCRRNLHLHILILVQFNTRSSQLCRTSLEVLYSTLPSSSVSIWFAILFLDCFQYFGLDLVFAQLSYGMKL